jgi:hypothetical protein
MEGFTAADSMQAMLDAGCQVVDATPPAATPLVCGTGNMLLGKTSCKAW